MQPKKNKNNKIKSIDMAISTPSTGKLRGLDWTLIITVLVLLGTCVYFMGEFNGRINSAHDKIADLSERVNKTDDRLDNIFEEIKNAQEKAKEGIKEISASQDNPIVFLNGRLGSGLNMGVNTSGGRTDWVKASGNEMCMSYPSGQSWGAVFITMGKPTQPPRPSKDFSAYRKIVLELKGAKGGEAVLVGLKDNQDPDDGSEAKIRLNLTKDWGNYEIKLAENFHTADLKKLYVVTEFVFESQAQTVCVRKIQFAK
jgi:hypothetical protein